MSKKNSNKDFGLNDKQEKFCREYVIDFNATQAAKRAGYSNKTAGQQGEALLKKLEIQRYIDSLKAKQNEELEITAAEITRNLKTIADRCMQAEPVIGNDGKPTGEYRFDAAAAIRAHELLGKRVGYFEKDNNQKRPMIPAWLSDTPEK